jgi:hypothetical protein
VRRRALSVVTLDKLEPQIAEMEVGGTMQGSVVRATLQLARTYDAPVERVFKALKALLADARCQSHAATSCFSLRQERCHKPDNAGPGQGRARHASRCRSQGGEGAGCTAAQTAVVHREAAGTATTSTVDTPRRFKQPAAGCARQPNCFAVLGKGRRKSRTEYIIGSATIFVRGPWRCADGLLPLPEAGRLS